MKKLSKDFMKTCNEGQFIQKGDSILSVSAQYFVFFIAFADGVQDLKVIGGIDKVL